MNEGSEEGRLLLSPSGTPIPEAEMKERLAEFTVKMCKANGVDPKDLLKTLEERYSRNK